MKVVKKIGLLLAALMLTVSVVGPAFSQDAADKAHKQTLELKEASTKANAWGSPAWGAGLGAGVAMGQAMMDAVKKSTSAPAGGAAPGSPAAETKFCSECGKPIPRSAKFCSECGKPQV